MKRIVIVVCVLLAGAAFAAPAYKLRLGDDDEQWFGDDGDFRIEYDAAGDSRLEVHDGTNLMLHLTDAGTTGNLVVTGTTTSTGLLTGSVGVKIPDNQDAIFGTDNDIKLRYDAATDNRLEFHDGTNLLMYLTDAGTTGTLGVSGDFHTGTGYANTGATITAAGAGSFDGAIIGGAGLTVGTTLYANVPSYTGKVGIGTATPSSLLHTKTTTGGLAGSMQIESTAANTTYIGQKIFRDSDSLWMAIDTATGSAFNTGVASPGVLWRSGNNPLCFVTDSTLRMTIAGTGAVTVAGDATVQGGDITAGVAATTTGQITLNHGTGTTPGYMALKSANGTTRYFYVSNSGTLYVHTAAPTADAQGSPVPTTAGAEYIIYGGLFKAGAETVGPDQYYYIKDIDGNIMMYVVDSGTTGAVHATGTLSANAIGGTPISGSTGAFTSLATSESEVTAFTGASTDTLDATGKSLVVLDLAAADTLVTISNGVSGQILRLMNIDAANDPTIDDEGGNIQLIGSNTDLVLGDLHDSVTLQFITVDNGTDLWVEIERCTGH